MDKFEFCMSINTKRLQGMQIEHACVKSRVQALSMASGILINPSNFNPYPCHIPLQSSKACCALMTTKNLLRLLNERLSLRQEDTLLQIHILQILQ